MDLINLAQDMENMWSDVNVVMKLMVPYNTGNP